MSEKPQLRLIGLIDRRKPGTWGGVVIVRGDAETVDLLRPVGAW